MKTLTKLTGYQTMKKYTLALLVLYTADAYGQTLIPGAFVTTWVTTTAMESITIPTHSSTYDYTVDWGDGSDVQTIITNTGPSHEYATPGTYMVSITGDFPRIYFNEEDNTNAAKIRTITQWGDIPWTSMAGAFDGCSRLTYTATDVPDLSRVTNMFAMFASATVFNGDLSGWNVSNVTNMKSMFFLAHAFNGNISDWNVGSVTNMRQMFLRAFAFKGDISDWNVGNVTDMSRMFWEAKAFNGDISDWNVSNVENMSEMFDDADAFTGGDLSDWNVSSVEDMSEMFLEADAFNGDISDWDVGSVTNMSKMFEDAFAFNGDISDWDVGSVTNMSRMFYEAEAFNGDISDWNVGKVTNMSGMFIGFSAFNGDLSGWDVGKVTDMSFMFFSADAFDRDLSKWDVSRVANFGSFLTNAELSPENYDALLIGWEKLDLQNSLTFDPGSSRYTSAGEMARQAIIDDDSWTFTTFANRGKVDVEVTFVENSTDMVRDINMDDTGNTYTLAPATTNNKIDDDNALFNIDMRTGELSFKNAPDFEDPQDAGMNNIYTAEVTVMNGSTVGKVVVSVSVTGVNEFSPVVDTEIPGLSLVEGFMTEEIDISNAFMDADAGDMLTFRASSANTAVVTAAVIAPGTTTLTLIEVGVGESVITVTANDGSNTVSDMFMVTVRANSAPTVVGTGIPGLSLVEGFMTEEIDISNAFMDADAGDMLTFRASSANTAVVTAAVIAPGTTTLTLIEGGVGESVITVTATDMGDLMVSDMFMVTVRANSAPTVVGTGISNLSLDTGFDTHLIELTDKFTDIDAGDVLTFSVSTNPPGVVTATIAPGGTTLTLTEMGGGESVITVTANDGSNTVSEEFTVTVNRAPTVVGTGISDLSLMEGGTEDIDLSGTFTDPDTDALMFTVSTSSPLVVTATIAPGGTTLTLMGAGGGSSVITVTAKDGKGGMASDMFIVNVNKTPTVVGTGISDLSLDTGFDTHVIELADKFTDPDAGDVLTFSVLTNSPGVVTATIAPGGTTLTLTEMGGGESVITVTANDGSNTVMDEFTVKVNRAPVVVATGISNQSLDTGFRTEEIDFSGTFMDPDTDMLMFTVMSDDESVVTATIAGNTLTLTEVGPGSSIITVTAIDGRGGMASDMFIVTVEMVTGVAEARGGFRAYPNPGSESLTVEMEGTGSLVRIYDFTGRHLHVPVRERSPRKVVLDISGLPGGIYLVKVSGGGGSTVRRLVVR